MKFECPECKLAGDVEDSRIPDQGAKATCPRCKASFFVQKKKEPPESETEREKCYCPKCGTAQPISDTCIKCGVVLSKFFDRQLQQTAQKQEMTAEVPTTAGPSVKRPHPTPSQNVTLGTKAKSNTKKSKVWVVLLVIVILAMIGKLAGHSPSNDRSSSTPPVTVPPATVEAKATTDIQPELYLSYLALLDSWMIQDGKFLLLICSLEGDTRNSDSTLKLIQTLKDSKTKTDEMLSRVQSPPSEFAQHYDRTLQLYSIYSKLYSMALNPSGTVIGYTENVAKTKLEFNQMIDQIKVTLPLDKVQKEQRMRFNEALNS